MPRRRVQANRNSHPAKPCRFRRSLLAGALSIGFFQCAAFPGNAATAAEISLDRMFPPVATAGATTTVAAEGKFDAWPVRVWCDRQDVVVTASEESGKLTVKVDEAAAQGVAWVRLYDDASASTLVPILIERVNGSVETEPNNEPSEATRVDLPAAIVGKLDKANEVDCFIVTAAAGQTLVVDVMANRVLGSPMDAVVQVVDKAGNVLAQSDDARGLDPQIAFVIPADGDYVIRLFAFPTVPNSTIGYSGGVDHVYRIHATVGPLVDHVLPLVGPIAVGPAEPRQPFGWNLGGDRSVVVSPATEVSPPIASVPDALGWHPIVDGAFGGGSAGGGDVAHFLLPPSSGDTGGDATGDASGEPTGDGFRIDQLPAIVSGHIDRPGQEIRLRASVVAGTRYRVAVQSQAIGLRLDSLVTVVQTDTGAELARNDDAPGSVGDAVAEFTPAASGDGATAETEVEIKISDLVGGYGIGHAMSVSVFAVQPRVTLGVDSDRFTIPPGGSIEIPVKVNRIDGFAEPLTVTVLGLPGGVTAAPVVSEPTGDSSKEVKLTLTATAGAGGDEVADAATPFQGPIRVVAHNGIASDDVTTNQPSGEPVATAAKDLAGGFKTRSVWLTVTGKPAEE